MAKGGKLVESKESKVVKKEKKPRAPSKFNLFMKDEIARVKEDNPELDHKSAFKQAAENWADSPENPKNQ